MDVSKVFKAYPCLLVVSEDALIQMYLLRYIVFYRFECLAVHLD